MVNISLKVLSCRNCGRQFVHPAAIQREYAENGWSEPSLCYECRRERKQQRIRMKEAAENVKTEADKQIERQKNHQKYEEELKFWNIMGLDSIEISSEETLYVVGNGFDMMHGVKSDYYSFRDSLGKNNRVRTTLEEYFTPIDIWADLEDGLAHFDLDKMCSNTRMDDWLDIYDAYNPESGEANFTMAAESAAEPLSIIANDLPKVFRKWVNTLSIGTDCRPLKSLFLDGKGLVLSFNYTEFAEVLYGVNNDHICYIHGCRKNKYGGVPEPLILGHKPGTWGDSAGLEDRKVWRKNPQNRHLVYAAQNIALEIISAYDTDLTKDCREIISKHEDFWSKLEKVKNVVIIGHSMSAVDRDYFLKIYSAINNPKDVKWYIGCHDYLGLNNLKQLISDVGISESQILLFRTDQIKVEFYPHISAATPQKAQIVHAKQKAISEDKKWSLMDKNGEIQIIDLSSGESLLNVSLSAPVSKAVFVSPTILFIISNGIVYIGRLEDNQWGMKCDLQNPNNQSIFNPRLNHIFLEEDIVTFVYNNRIRSYNMQNGMMIKNYAVRDARSRNYTGEDIYGKFDSRV